MEYDRRLWRAYADQLGFPKTEQAEKDYLQELLLMNINSSADSKYLVFRGGTAIAKLYGSGRFSEDLDFISVSDSRAKGLENIIEAGINSIKYRYDLSFSKKQYRNMVKYTIKINGPMFSASLNRQAVQTIEVDFNTYEHPLLNPREIPRNPIYEDLRPYSIITIQPEELAADKIKTIIERTRPMSRDLYDLWILLEKYKITPNLKIVEEKLELYPRTNRKTFTQELFDLKLKEMSKIWKAELSRLIKTVPDYGIVVRNVESAIKR